MQGFVASGGCAAYHLCGSISDDLRRPDIEFQAGNLVHLHEVTFGVSTATEKRERGASPLLNSGADVLLYRHAGEHSFHRHLLNAPRQVIDAERWLRDALSDGAVDAETASLIRWNDKTNSVEVGVGEPNPVDG